MHTYCPYALSHWRVVCLIIVLVAGYVLQVWAARVSMHTFGRYEIMIQEGLPVAIGEIIGTVRRQTGLPEYPLILGTQERVLDLSILGPGNRPTSLASTPFTGPRGPEATVARFIVEHSARQDEMLILWLRQANTRRPGRVAVDLRNLERMLEGTR